MAENEDDVDAPKTAKRPGVPVDWHRLVRALLVGKLWLLVAALIGTGMGYLVGKFAVPHTYEAGASIRYEGLPGEDHFALQRELPAKVSITHSEPIMIALRDRMEMSEVSIDLMRRMVQVESDAGSGLVSFKTTGETPEVAAAMANALVEIFLTHHREARRSELTTEMQSIDERAIAANAELSEARGAYDAFRTANQITDLTTEQEQAITQAAELRSQADLAGAEIRALEARLAQLRRQLGETPRTETVSAGPSASSQRLRELTQRLAEARGQGLGNEHPTVQSLERQVESLRGSGGGGDSTRTSVSSAHQSIAQAVGEARAELEAARERHVSLERLATEAHARTSRFSAIEGDAANLLAQVNVKQALVQEMTERRARLVDQLRDVETGFRSVAAARPPESAVPSKRKLGVAAGIPVAFVLIMVGMLLFRELRGLTVETASEVAYWGNGPVIGTTRWPRDPAALLDLIADLDDFAPAARGSILVVGATEKERAQAMEVAHKLHHDWSTGSSSDRPPAMPGLPALPPLTQPRLPNFAEGLVLEEGGGSPRPPIDNVLQEYLEDKDPISGEFLDGPTELVRANEDPLGVIDGPTEVSMGYVNAPRALESDARLDLLVCTAWSGASDGQALRRAARLADRVLVVVPSGLVRATDLAKTSVKLGREDGIGYVVIGASEAVAKLPDRAGPVEQFWTIHTPESRREA